MWVTKKLLPRPSIDKLARSHLRARAIALVAQHGHGQLEDRA